MSPDTIRLAASGDSDPSPETRAKLAVLGIPEIAWQSPPKEPQESTPDDGDVPLGPGQGSPEQRLRAQLRRIDEQRQKGRLTARALIDLERTELAVIGQLAKFDEPAGDLDTLFGRIIRALDDFPAAQRRVALVLAGDDGRQEIADLARDAAMFPAEVEAVAAAEARLSAASAKHYAERQAMLDVASGLQLIHFHRFHRGPVIRPVARKQTPPLLTSSTGRRFAYARETRGRDSHSPAEG